MAAAITLPRYRSSPDGLDNEETERKIAHFLGAGNRSLFISNINTDRISPLEIKRFFTQKAQRYGTFRAPFKEAWYKYGTNYATLHFTLHQEAVDCFRALDGLPFNGTPLYVRWFHDKKAEPDNINNQEEEEEEEDVEDEGDEWDEVTLPVSSGALAEPPVQSVMIQLTVADPQWPTATNLFSVTRQQYYDVILPVLSFIQGVNSN